MFTAIHSSGATILSLNTDNRGHRYTCPYCHEPVYLRKDRKLNVKRFFHADSASKPCQLKWRESDTFYHCQLEMFTTLKEDGVEVVIDARIQPHQRVFSPLMARLNGVWVGIEIESPLLSHDSINRVYKIAKYYAKNNIPVLWVLLDGVSDARMLYRLKSHERHIANLYGGLLLFWRKGVALSLCQVYSHRYASIKQKNQPTTITVHKQIVRLVFAPYSVTLYSLAYKPAYLGDGVMGNVATSQINYDWPLLEKPEPF